MLKEDKLMRNAINRQLDGVILSDKYSMRYYSGFTGAEGYVLLTKDKKIIVTDFRYTEQVSLQSPDFTCCESKNLSYEEKLTQIIKDNNLNRLGFEDQSITFKQYMTLRNLNFKTEFIEFSNEIDLMRQIKDEYEISNIGKAENIGDIAFNHILDFIMPGVTEMEIALELEYTMKKHGAEALSFDTIVASGENSSRPHAVVTKKPIENGDFVTMDFGCIYNGYCSDMTRTIVVGKASEEQKKIYNIVLEAQNRAIEYIKEGIPCNEIHMVAQDIISRAGYKENFGHGLGHSVGLFIHESPRFSPKCRNLTKKNMVITVEPGIYIPGKYGVRIEDLIVVKENKCINLTSSKKDLIEL